MLAPNGRNYNRIADHDRFVCEWHIGHGTDTRDWCSALALWGAPRLGDFYRDGALNFLCDDHFQELMEGAVSAEPMGARYRMATRTTAGTITGALPDRIDDRTHINDYIDVDDFRPLPRGGTYVCEFVVPRPGNERNWCNAPALWHNTSSTRTAGTPGFLCVAHYEERTRIQHPPIAETPFGRLAALIMTVENVGVQQTLRSALSPYLRSTSRQLATLRGTWQQVAAALVVRDLRKRGLLDELLVREDSRPFDAMSRAASRTRPT